MMIFCGTQSRNGYAVILLMMRSCSYVLRTRVASICLTRDGGSECSDAVRVAANNMAVVVLILIADDRFVQTAKVVSKELGGEVWRTRVCAQVDE